MIRLSIADSLVALYESDDTLILLGHQENVAACRLWATTQKLVVDEELPNRYNGLLDAEVIYNLTDTQAAMFLLKFK